MELQEFITQTLIQIVEGVEAARAKKKERIAPGLDITRGEKQGVFFTMDNNVAHLVELDVAITAKDKTETGGKAAIQVISALSIGGGKAKEMENSSVSRVKFEVPISYDIVE
jgi:hypothetical protein